MYTKIIFAKIKATFDAIDLGLTCSCDQARGDIWLKSLTIKYHPKLNFEFVIIYYLIILFILSKIKLYNVIDINKSE